MKQQWIAALRSGEYAQHQGCLRHANSFCCLGVLADLAWPNQWKKDDTIRNMSGCLLESRLRELGIDPFHAFEAMHMNDKGCSFNDIANYLEVNL